METLFIYLIKSGGLIGMFYLAYYFMLREETFFNSNRWFLLAGLISSAVLPLLFFTKKIWVQSSPSNFDFSKIPLSTSIAKDSFEINWYIIFGIAYSIGIVMFLLKLAFDFYSLSKVLKGKTIQHQSDFKFINVTEKVSPFSYFNYIVYNSDLYSEAELENIIEHEKVHSTQNHTVDVLISRLFCIVFWFNPLVWLYKKAIEQNLEFIADSEALKNISDKKAYQITLLKITTQENCVAITNHFYQSLIKKRIVMLNKNQSKKRNSWKYALVLPLLIAFVFLFQIKVIAQEKTTVNTTKVEPIGWVTNKNATDEEMNQDSKTIKEKLNIDYKFSKVKRNSNGEIVTLRIKYITKDGKSGVVEFDSDKPIDPIYFNADENNVGFSMHPNHKVYTYNNGKDSDLVTKTVLIKREHSKNSDKDSTFTKSTEIYINGDKVAQNDLDELDQNTIETMNVDKNSGKSTIKIITKKGSNIPDDTEIFVNGKKISKEEMDKLDNSTIETIDVSKTGTTQNTIKIITRKTEIKDVEQAKKDAEQAKKDAHQAKIDAEQAKIDSEQAKKDAQQAKIDAEQAKKGK